MPRTAPPKWHPSPSSTRCPHLATAVPGAPLAPRQHPILRVPGAAAAIPASPTRRLGDRSADSDLSPLNVMRSFYWSPSFTVDPEWEQVLLDELLLSETGVDGYPGDMQPSENWPNFAPGTRGILNALSGKYCNWSAIVDIEPKPPVLWTHGSNDLVVADESPWEMGALGKLGVIPGWPGEEEYPPQPMVTQIRTVLDQYTANGGGVQVEMFDGSGHRQLIDAPEQSASSSSTSSAPHGSCRFAAALRRIERLRRPLSLTRLSSTQRVPSGWHRHTETASVRIGPGGATRATARHRATVPPWARARLRRSA